MTQGHCHPLIPVYLAAVCAYSATWRRLALGTLATLPLFVALGIVRLLMVALPDAVASPLFVVHAFYQLLLGAVIVFLAALWRHGRRTALPYALAGVVVGMLSSGCWSALHPRDDYRSALRSPIEGPSRSSAFTSASTSRLGAAFAAIGWGRLLLGGLAVLGLTQTKVARAARALGLRGLTAPVRDVRAWAVTGQL